MNVLSVVPEGNHDDEAGSYSFKTNTLQSAIKLGSRKNHIT